MTDSQNISIEETKRQVERIVQSHELKSSPRLQEFLRYIVDEHLAGRAGRIKGVTIAQAVFEAGDSFDSESNSIVRVEAGRLRRRLTEYYLAAGASDPIVVEVPKGGYVPAFRRREADLENGGGSASTDAPSRRRPGNRPILTATGVLAIALIASWAWFMYRFADQPDTTNGAQIQSPGQFDDEAAVLARQAWELLVPPEDSKRLETATELFDLVIERAPNRSLGYTGKSFTRSIAVLFFKSGNPESDLTEAFELARQAVDIDADYNLGWTAMALSRSLAGDGEAALAYALKAADDIPADAITPAMLGLVLLLSERPEDARALMLDSLERLPVEPRTPFLNVLGQALYLTGDYEGAAESFEKNLSIGGPWGPHLDLFLAATYQQLGREFRARAILEKMKQESPDFPCRDWMAWFVKPAGRLEETLARLRYLGLADNPS